MQQGLLSDLSRGRDNNLTLLRFIAASLVIYTHAFGVTGNGKDEPLVQLCGLSLGSWAVDVFFVVSGFLITKSWYRRQDLTEFLYARFMRIYPALWVAVFVCVFIVGPLFTTLSITQYFTHIDTMKFLLENITLLIKGVFPTLPGVFENHPSTNVNSPLWTLPFELKMYLLLAALSILGLTIRRFFLPPMVLVALIAFVIGYLELDLAFVSYTETARFIFFFFSGALIFINRDVIQVNTKWAGIIGGACVVAFLLPVDPDFKRLVLALATPYLVIYLAFAPSGRIRNFNRLGDYSYGIYIYGFPIQQVMFSLFDSSSVLLNFVTSWAVCLMLAMLSWHFLEERALHWSMPGWLRRLQRMLPDWLRGSQLASRG